MAPDHNSDEVFERRYWRAQRIGWALMGLFLLLAALGLFRGPPLGQVILRALVIYLGLLVLFRIAGRRTMAQITPFDLVLLLIISEAIQPALLGQSSLVEAMILVTTLVGADIVLGEITQRNRRLERLVEGAPVLLVSEGQPIQSRLAATHVTIEDILAAGRENGLERLEQIRYAILETTRRITVIAK